MFGVPSFHWLDSSLSFSSSRGHINTINILPAYRMLHLCSSSRQQQRQALRPWSKSIQPSRSASGIGGARNLNAARGLQRRCPPRRRPSALLAAQRAPLPLSPYQALRPAIITMSVSRGRDARPEQRRLYCLHRDVRERRLRRVENTRQQGQGRAWAAGYRNLNGIPKP